MIGCIGNALRHHAHFGPNGGDFFVQAWQFQHLDARHGFEFFGVDHGTVPSQRNRTAGVACAAAPRNDRETQGEAAFDQAGHFGFCVGGQNHKGVLNTPVGGVGNVADSRQCIKLDVVFGGDFTQSFLGFAAQLRHVAEVLIKRLHGTSGQHQKLGHQTITQSVNIGGATLLNFSKPMAQGLDQQLASVRVVQ